MQQDNLNTGNKKLGLIISSIIITVFLIWDIFLFFDKTAITAKLLAASSFILLLSLLILFWTQMLRNMKQGKD